jgi:spore coat protein CotH
MLMALGFVAGSVTVQPAFAAQSLANFYNNTSIHSVYLTIPDASVANLNQKPKDYTGARVEFRTDTSGSSGLIDIGLRLKGSTSLEKLSGRASFKIKFNWKDLKGDRFLGLKDMTLNAMTQDTSLVHEAAAYQFYNWMGIPASKTGYAKVYVNGVFKGLYLNIETPDDIFLSKRFTNPTQHLYEAIALKDLKPGNDWGNDTSGAYLVDEGWKTTPNKLDLKKLIEVANIANLPNWWTQLGVYTNRSLLIKTFAVENFIGHWDSYSGPIINNHFWRSDDTGKFTMIPWGLDNTFGEDRATSVLGDSYFFTMDTKEAGYPWVKIANKKDALPRGLLFQKCLDYKPCKTEYLTDLKLVSAKATSMQLTTFMANSAKLIKQFAPSSATTEQTRTINWVKLQQGNVAALLKKYGIK